MTPSGVLTYNGATIDVIDGGCPVSDVFQNFPTIFVNYTVANINTPQAKFMIDFKAFTFDKYDNNVLRYFCYLYLCPDPKYCEPVQLFHN